VVEFTLLCLPIVGNIYTFVTENDSGKAMFGSLRCIFIWSTLTLLLISTAALSNPTGRVTDPELLKRLNDAYEADKAEFIRESSGLYVCQKLSEKTISFGGHTSKNLITQKTPPPLLRVNINTTAMTMHLMADNFTNEVKLQITNISYSGQKITAAGGYPDSPYVHPISVYVFRNESLILTETGMSTRVISATCEKFTLDNKE